MSDDGGEVKQMQYFNASDTKKECPLRPIRILSQNCYLVPNGLTYNPIFWSCRNQKERAVKLNQMVKEVDISAFQEVWGTQMDVLEQGLGEEYEVQPEYCAKENSWTNLTRTVTNTLSLYWRKQGGLWHAWKKQLEMLRTGVFPFAKSVPFANQGVRWFEFDLSEYSPGKRLLLFNMHFDITGASRRMDNLRELRFCIVNVLWSYFCQGRDLSKYAVLLTGDFNIRAYKGEGKQYKRLMSCVEECRDLYCFKDEAQHTHKHTLMQGKKEEKKGNSYFPWPVEGIRVDHVIAVDLVSFSDDELTKLLSKQETVEAKISSPVEQTSFRLAHIECVHYEIDHPPYGEEVADHYGNLVHIVVKDSKSPNNNNNNNNNSSSSDAKSAQA